MKKRILMFAFVVIAFQSVMAQLYNSVFPILNTVPKYANEFVAASIDAKYDYLGKAVWKASFISQYADGKQLTSQVAPSGYSFLTFSYVTKNNGVANGQWNSGSETTQILFHPGYGGYHDKNYAIVNTTYGFVFNETDGLFLCDVNGMNIIAKLCESTDIADYAFLSVYAGTDYTMKDIIVVAGKNNFKVYETIPDSNGVRAISYSGAEPSYFGINGQKYDEPQQGLNIVVDGETTKKIVVK